jgi:hypothetical protein
VLQRRLNERDDSVEGGSPVVPSTAVSQLNAHVRHKLKGTACNFGRQHPLNLPKFDGDSEHKTKIVASRAGKLLDVPEPAVIDEPPRDDPPNPERHFAWPPVSQAMRAVDGTVNVDVGERQLDQVLIRNLFFLALL